MKSKITVLVMIMTLVGVLSYDINPAYAISR